MQKKFPFIVTSLAALVCFAPHDSQAGSSPSAAPWQKWVVFEKGYFDPESKEFALLPEFDELYDFADNGLAIVKKRR